MMKNERNIHIYKKLAPFYDSLLGNQTFSRARRRAFELLCVKSGQKLLLVGIGTGEDLAFIDPDTEVWGIDLSEAMMNRARAKARGHLTLQVMNAEDLEFADAWFDICVCDLILSVVENPRQAFGEALRVLKPGGQMLIFDKFLPDGQTASFVRRLLNRFASSLGTDITRSFREIATDHEYEVIHRELSLFAGNYQIIIIKKPSNM